MSESDEPMTAAERQTFLDLGVPAALLDADPASLAAALREDTPTHDAIAEALRKRAAAIFTPEVYDSWLDGENDYLEGARPRYVLARRRYTAVFEALAAEEQKVWGS
ncbi:unannotated protein [freshwater metagenome]|uniref:Unannotated protein n=1 Tax=freshwater metagenome TaxID=449393 RepID=A0A6J6RYM1_9ZZZZ|nr:hypothetical protein [Actinomycetota bacterium]